VFNKFKFVDFIDSVVSCEGLIINELFKGISYVSSKEFKIVEFSDTSVGYSVKLIFVSLVES
jgi:hypothetical protein